MPSVMSTGRTVTRELLEAMRRTHPLEHAMACLLIREGTWTLADSDGEKTATRDIASMPGMHARSDTRGTTYATSLIDARV